MIFIIIAILLVVTVVSSTICAKLSPINQVVDLEIGLVEQFKGLDSVTPTAYELDYDKYEYCPNCGQRIDWSDIK